MPASYGEAGRGEGTAHGGTGKTRWVRECARGPARAAAGLCTPVCEAGSMPSLSGGRKRPRPGPEQEEAGESFETQEAVITHRMGKGLRNGN